MRSPVEKNLICALVPLHILHHAGEHPVYGLWIIEELARHGYTLGAGTLYPLLHRMENRGLLRSMSERAGSRMRRVYRITPLGKRALSDAKHKVRELFGEMFAPNRRRGVERRRLARPPARRVARRKAR